MALKLGVQMYSVRDYMTKNPIDTIDKVGKMGYRYLEFANFDVTKDLGVGFGTPVDELKRKFDELGVFVAGLHFQAGGASYDVIDFPKLFEAQKVLGNRNIVLPCDVFGSEEEIKVKADQYNHIGGLCKDAGFRFCFHNHVELGQIFNGRLALDILAESTDPELVNFEVDTYWALRAGLDPVAVLKKLGSRVAMLHQKDLPSNLEDPVNVFSENDPSEPFALEKLQHYAKLGAFAEIGTGVMNIQAVIDAALDYTAAEYVILEQDNTRLDQFESLRISAENFRKIRGVQIG